MAKKKRVAGNRLKGKPRDIIIPTDHQINMSQDEYIEKIWELFHQWVRLRRNRGYFEVYQPDNFATYANEAIIFAQWARDEGKFPANLKEEDIRAPLMKRRKSDAEKKRKALRLKAFQAQSRN